MPEIESKGEGLSDQPKLILLDLDGTVLNTDYSLSDVSVMPAIMNAQESGWLIGLSSDRSVEGIKKWQTVLQTQGPIIGERGAVIEHETKLYFDAKEKDVFPRARQNLVEKLSSIGVRSLVGPPETHEEAEGLVDGETLVYMNFTREFSLAFHVRVYGGNGNLHIDDSVTEMVAAQAEETYPVFEDRFIDMNHDYGVVIVSNAKNTKRLGTQRLLELMGLDQCIMIGDTMVDYIGDDVATHYAVGNASSDFKEHAVYVANDNKAKGVAEILRFLAD